MRGLATTALLIAIVAGCRPAERYGHQPVRETSAKKPIETEAPKPTESKPLDPEIQWIDIDNPPKPDASIDFVHAEKAPEAWSKLTKFWNEATATQTDPKVKSDTKVMPVIQIKVPLGLPDPREYIPAGETMTLDKWKLGQRLFFDENWLEAKTGTSCATCHRPSEGFADHIRTHGDGFNAPTLINCVFNRFQFADGRAVLLEEVVQRTLEDEKSDPSKPFRHTWSGVIARLRNKADYHEEFNRVFGKPAGEADGAEKTNITQDTVGRALACYLRTLLAGDSIHDRAVEHARKQGPTPKVEDYEAVLDDAALTELGRDKVKKSTVAAELMRGYMLFHGLDKSRPLVNCYQCHSGRTFSDNEFHNLGIAASRPGKEGGRFAQVPIGQKNRYLIDAYKTPTLRGLRRTSPYFHNGSVDSLREVVEFYNTGAKRNNYLDPNLRLKDGQTRLLGLNAAEIDALVLFLNALNGREVDDVLKTPSPKSTHP
jgi:cytochrome c peroxidase